LLAVVVVLADRVVTEQVAVVLGVIALMFLVS
jgi:hypothetical protein